MGGTAGGNSIINVGYDITKDCRKAKEMLEKTGQITLNEIAKESYETARKRQENGANISVETRNMLKHCATEVVEAMEAYSVYACFQDDKELDLDIRCFKDRFAAELADIVCCAAIIAGKEHIDLDRAIANCLKKNRLRAEGKGDKK